MLEIFKTNQTVFDLKDLSNLFWEPNYNNLKSRVSYYVRKGYISRIRRWIFVKDDFNYYELACKIYSPSYISFETILFDEWIIYQVDSTIYVASYLSRTIEIEYMWKTIKIVYRKLKDNLLFDDNWVLKKEFYSIASRNRAISDIKYLKPDFYFDNLK